MKKWYTLFSMGLMAVSLQVFPATKPVGLPGFFDNFTVNLNSSSITPQIIYMGNSGGIYVTQSSCNQSSCQFVVTDGDSGESGHVRFQIGSQNGPYCTIDVKDGAWMSDATMNADCENGASMDYLQHTDQFQYEVNMFADGKKANVK